MSNELTFHANRTKTALIFIGCVAFFVGGYLLRTDEPLIAWACMIFFGLCIPASLFMLLSPSSMYLRLDPEGFEIGSLVKKTRTKWTDVERFALGSIRGVKMIAIVYAPHYEGQKIGRAVASNLSGMEGAIPNSYNVPLTELLKALNEWRGRYGRPR